MLLCVDGGAIPINTVSSCADYQVTYTDETMDELCLLLENVRNDINTLKRQVIFETETYENFLKPWHCKTTNEENKQRKTAVSAPQLPAENKYDEDLEKVDKILRKAKLVREQTSSKALKNHSKEVKRKEQTRSHSAATAKPKAVQISNERGKKTTERSSAKNTKVSSSIPTYAKLKSQRPSIANEIKSTPLVENKQIDSASSNLASLKQPEEKRLMLEEILSHQTISVKYQRLVNMHKRLKSDERLQDSTHCLSSNAEKRFICKLYSGSQPCTSEDADIPKYDDVPMVITADAANAKLNCCLQRCQNLINIVSYRLPTTALPADTKSEATQLYKQKLVYTKANEITQELENCQTWLKSSLHVNVSMPGSEVSLLRKCSIESHQIPSRYLTYQKAMEPILYKQSLYEMQWLKTDLFLKKKIHEVLLAILQEYSLRNDSDKDRKTFNRDQAICFTTAFGLLSQKNRCSINPAIVWD